ncbi:hypothetical protein NA57DRAFT_70125 [Rhizodiscina lignyota]|uniref:Uncharacterized protein n=1 Tax=Rhizodiscina lignyota TaxID=1504668 RepID=A0A9P4IR91_9PEZI|nr:hypothetical protein NA57DRAFT_70125 [Rhizodiscina lignyota]
MTLQISDGPEVNFSSPPEILSLIFFSRTASEAAPAYEDQSCSSTTLNELVLHDDGIMGSSNSTERAIWDMFKIGDAFHLVPSAFCEAISKVLSALETTSTSLSQLRACNKEPPQLNALTSHCHELYKAYVEVEQVFKVYARVWDPEEDLGVDPPFDPKLIGTIASVHCALQVAQASVSRVIGPKKHTGNPPEFEEAEKQLAQQVKLIQEFLPIMKADLDEFVQVAKAVENVPSYIRLDAFIAPQYHNGSIESLRDALYQLKDELATVLKTVQEPFGDGMADFLDVNPGLADLPMELAEVFNAINEALTNNGSEWIESMLGGKLAYNEFLKISHDDIREFRYDFRQLRANFVRMRASCRAKNGTLAVWDVISEIRKKVAELRKMFKVPDTMEY